MAGNVIREIKKIDTLSLKQIINIVCPILFSIYPVIFLYTHNIQMLRMDQLILPISFAIILALVCFALWKKILKNNIKASLATTAFLIIFWYYDFIFKGFNYFIDLNHWHVLPLLIFIYGHFVYFLYCFNKKRNLVNVNQFLFTFTFFLIMYNFFIAMPGEIQKQLVASEFESNNTTIKTDGTLSTYPDIYYIIFDEYARVDSIKREWGYDNKEFAKFLKDSGFYLAKESLSRDISTLKVMPEIANIRYFYNERSDSELIALYHNNYLFDYFNKLDYEVIFFDGWRHGTGGKIPDYVNLLTYEKVIEEQAESKGFLYYDTFSILLIERSILSLLGFMKLDQTDVLYYDGNLAVIDYLKNVAPYKESPKFIFAHIMCPHLPYVFDRDGNLTNNKTHYWQYENYSKAELRGMYLEQYIFITKEIKSIIKAIQAKNEDALIIIQSDHGPRPTSAGNISPEEALKVLNAIYFPDKNYGALYKSISPVNTIRIVLNQYFGESHELLED